MQTCRNATILAWLRPTGRILLISLCLAIAAISGAVQLAARSLDPSECSENKRRVEYGNLVFCWPIADSAPAFRIESPKIFIGSQYWIEGRPASSPAIETAVGSQTSESRETVVVVFRIVPFDHALVRGDWSLAAASQVKSALEGRDDKSQVELDLYLGEKIGTREIQFREIEPKLFVADLTITEESVARTLEYWAPLNDDRSVDYVMSCHVFERLRTCSVQFFLAGNVATFTLQRVKSASQARQIFEAMRAQIRSYVISPALDMR